MTSGTTAALLFVVGWVWVAFLVTTIVLGHPSFGWTALLSLPAAWWANAIETMELPK